METYIKIVNKHYQKTKDKLQKEAQERYKNLSEEGKEKMQKKGPRQIYKSFGRRKTKKHVSIIEFQIKIFLKTKK